jgi:hypothetical protein
MIPENPTEYDILGVFSELETEIFAGMDCNNRSLMANLRAFKNLLWSPEVEAMKRYQDADLTLDKFLHWYSRGRFGDHRLEGGWCPHCGAVAIPTGHHWYFGDHFMSTLDWKLPYKRLALREIFIQR